MRYEKILVNGKQYEYMIGKEKTEIKGVGVFDNSVIGNPVFKNKDVFVVTELNIRAVLLGQKLPPKVKNSEGRRVIQYMVNPLVEEVYDRQEFFPYSKRDYQACLDDI